MHGVSAGVFAILFVKQVRAPVIEIVNGVNNCNSACIMCSICKSGISAVKCRCM